MAKKAKKEHEEMTTEGDTNPAPTGFQHIKIQGNMFAAPAPYVEGHVCSASEAAALNSVLGENLRNNFAAQMKAAAAAGREIPGQAEFEAYASTYHFGMKRVRVATTADPIGGIERSLAEQAVKDRVAQLGHKWRDMDKDQKNAFIQRAIDSGKFRAEAERVYAKRQEAQATLGDLFGDMEVAQAAD